MQQSSDVSTTLSSDGHATISVQRYTEKEVQMLLETIRTSLSRLYHDASTPLSVIAGNIEFLRHLASMTKVENEFIGPLEDLEAAAQHLNQLLDRLLELRNHIARSKGPDGA
ncbi:MAG: hypothetical protein D6746_13330 [Bacteroidetes bacterium]|nr:MAG: hypothetical protein D6746_13330 [Bacteroidota bacterium]